MFVSSQCNSWGSYLKGKCEKNPKNFMGIAVNYHLPGIYYIKTKTSQYYDGRNFYNYVLDRIGNRLANLLKLDFLKYAL